jgi:hypothetical protein
MQHDDPNQNMSVHLSRVRAQKTERRELTDLKRELEAYLRVINFALHSPIESEIGAAILMVRGDLRRLVGGDDL